jgi:leucyl-tRNA synthetase
LLLLLAPMAPYITEELWQRLGQPGHHHSIHTASWPIFDAGAIHNAMMILPVQVNGRVRGRIEVAHDTPEAEIKRQALLVPQVQPFIAAQKVSRMIYVPGRLINIVTA